MIDLITKDDLKTFKEELIEELQSILVGKSPIHKETLKSREVMGLLGCSESKLASLRASGKLPSTKLQGTYYYKISDINSLLK